MEEITLVCPICLKDNLNDNLNNNLLCKTSCGHTFCKTCIDPWFNKGRQDCPMCRSRIDYFTHDSINYRTVFHNKIEIMNPIIPVNSRRGINQQNIVRGYKLLAITNGVLFSSLLVMGYLYYNEYRENTKYEDLYYECKNGV